jgi:hypothetical protein
MMGANGGPGNSSNTVRAALFFFTSPWREPQETSKQKADGFEDRSSRVQSTPGERRLLDVRTRFRCVNLANAVPASNPQRTRVSEQIGLCSEMVPFLSLPRESTHITQTFAPSYIPCAAFGENTAKEDTMTKRRVAFRGPVTTIGSWRAMLTHCPPHHSAY